MLRGKVMRGESMGESVRVFLEVKTGHLTVSTEAHRNIDRTHDVDKFVI